MANGNYLTDEQIQAGADNLTGGKLKASQVDDLVSICRKYLKGYASNYPLRSTFENLQDDLNNNRCAKLSACLMILQDVQFDNSAFAATNANRTGFTDSTLAERYDVFEYFFGLFWDIPLAISNSFQLQTSSTQGISKRVYPKSFLKM